MKLFVELIDSSTRIAELEHLGECATPIRRRIVWITLTPEQADQIAPCQMESIGNVWVETLGGEEE